MNDAGSDISVSGIAQPECVLIFAGIGGNGQFSLNFTSCGRAVAPDFAGPALLPNVELQIVRGP